MKQGVQCVSQKKGESHCHKKLWFARLLRCFHKMVVLFKHSKTHDMRKTPIEADQLSNLSVKNPGVAGCCQGW